jgi:hypothetical protein
MQWKIAGLVAAAALLYAAAELGGLGTGAPVTLGEFIAQGGLDNPGIPPLEDLGSINPLTGYDFDGRMNRGFVWAKNVRVSDIPRMLRTVLMGPHPELYAEWQRVLKRHAGNRPFIIGGKMSLIDTGEGLVWIASPPFRTLVAPEGGNVRGYTREEASGRVDCPCLETGPVCVIRHKDFVQCVTMIFDDPKRAFGMQGYYVFEDTPFPDISQRFRFENILTPLKYLRARGRL